MKFMKLFFNMRNIVAQYFLSKYFYYYYYYYFYFYYYFAVDNSLMNPHILFLPLPPPPLYPRSSITVSFHFLSFLQKLTRSPNRPLKGRALLDRAIYSYGQLSLKLGQIHFQGKPHTAVAKFREALQQNFEQLEALFNICLQYRKLGNFVAEIQCLKLLKQVRKENDVGRWGI